MKLGIGMFGDNHYDASGKPRPTRERLRELGLTRFSAHMDVGGPSHAALMKSNEIYRKKIAPKVREALKQ